MISRNNGRVAHLLLSGGKGLMLMMKRVAIARRGGEKVVREEGRREVQSPNMRWRKLKQKLMIRNMKMPA